MQPGHGGESGTRPLGHRFGPSCGAGSEWSPLGGREVLHLRLVLPRSPGVEAGPVAPDEWVAHTHQAGRRRWASTRMTAEAAVYCQEMAGARVALKMAARAWSLSAADVLLAARLLIHLHAAAAAAAVAAAAATPVLDVLDFAASCPD